MSGGHFQDDINAVIESYGDRDDDSEKGGLSLIYSGSGVPCTDNLTLNYTMKLDLLCDDSEDYFPNVTFVEYNTQKCQYNLQL